MRRLLGRALIAAVGVCCLLGVPGRADARGPTYGIIPDNFDLSGVWVLRGEISEDHGIVTDFPFAQYDSYDQYQLGQDYWKFEPNGGHSGDYGSLVYDYNITYVTTYQFYAREAHPADRNHVHYWTCAVETLTFQGTGSLTYQPNYCFETPDGTECEWEKISFDGSLLDVDDPNHFVHVGGVDFPAVPGTITHPDNTGLLFDDQQGNWAYFTPVIDYSGTGTASGDPPGNCVQNSDYLYFPTTRIGSSSDYRGGPNGILMWQRSPDVPAPVTASIKGTLHDKLPDGTQTDDPIVHAKVEIVPQDKFIVPQASTETDDDYAARVRATQDFSHAKRAEVDDSGNFAFDDLPVITRNDGEPGFHASYYTLHIRYAYRDYTDVDGGVMHIEYNSRTIANLIPADRQPTVYWLTQAPNIVQKRHLIAKIGGLGPNQYKPVEDQVSAYLDGLSSSPTDAQSEGVNRAVWAERFAYTDASYAKQVIDIAVSQLGTLLGKLIEKYNPLKSREAQQAKAKLEEAGSASLQNWLKGESADEAKAELGKLLKTNVGQNVKVANILKKLLDGGFTPVQSYLSAKPDTDKRAKSALDMLGKLRSVMFSAIDIFSAKDTSSGFSALIPLLVKKMGGELFDNSTDALSWTGHTRYALEFSRDQMQNWSVADRTAYATDRTALVDLLSQMDDTLTNRLWWATMLDAAASACDTASTVFSYAQFIPQVKAADTVAKVTSVSTRLAMLGEALYYALYSLPTQLDAGVALAYGLDAIPQASALSAAATYADPATALWDTANTDAAATLDAMTALGEALAADKVTDALASASSDDWPLDRYLRDANLVLLAGRRPAAGDDQAAYLRALENLQSQYAQLLVEADGFKDQETNFFLQVFSGAYQDATDPIYRLRRRQLVDATHKLHDRVGDVAALITEMGNYNVQVAPMVAVDDVTAVSTQSGKPTVASSGEEFTVTAKIANLSSVAVSDVVATLQVSAGDGRVTIEGEASQTLPELAAQGAGPTPVSWTVRYDGAMDDPDSVVLTVNLTEDQVDGQPAHFLAEAGSVYVGVARDLLDADNDGLVDSFEAQYGLDTGGDDYNADPDGDGVPNYREYQKGTDPTAADTDGDGVDDRDELDWGTDPLLADTDGDGVDDGADGSPLDPGSSTAQDLVDYEEPVVAVDKTDVELTPDQSVAVIEVTNAGGGTLRWTAADPQGLAKVSPGPYDVRVEGQHLVISSPFDAKDLDDVKVQTDVRVFDVSGTDKDQVTIHVQIGTGLHAPGTGGDAGGGGDAGDGDAGYGGTDSGAALSGHHSSGCGCTTPGAPAEPVWPFLLSVGAVAGLGLRRKVQAD